ncbi:MAG: hypothetical protein ACTSQO_12250 [Candidatus Helarchaeota archaeon]
MKNSHLVIIDFIKSLEVMTKKNELAFSAMIGRACTEPLKPIIKICNIIN